MSVALRPMTVDDAAAVSAIEAMSFADPWTAEAFCEELEAPRRSYVVADDAGVWSATPASCSSTTTRTS